MNDDPTPRDALTPAEMRLRKHLEVLRETAPQPDSSLIERVGRATRWQRAVRAPMRAAGMLAAALGEGIGLALGARRGRRR